MYQDRKSHKILSIKQTPCEMETHERKTTQHTDPTSRSWLDFLADTAWDTAGDRCQWRAPRAHDPRVHDDDVKCAVWWEPTGVAGDLTQSCGVK